MESNIAALTVNSDVWYERTGITLDLTKFDNPRMGNVSLFVKGLKEGDQYVMDAFIDGMLVASSLPIVADGDRKYCFTFRPSVEHHDMRVGLRLRNVYDGPVQIDEVQTAQGVPLRIR